MREEIMKKFIALTLLLFAVVSLGNYPVSFMGGGVEFPDDIFQVFDDLDNTKTFQFQADQITTGTNRVYTVPDLDGTFVLGSGTDNQIATFNGANSLDSSANLTFDGSTLGLTGSETVSGDITVDGTIYGGDGSDDDLILESTSDATKGNVEVQGGILLHDYDGSSSEISWANSTFNNNSGNYKLAINAGNSFDSQINFTEAGSNRWQMYNDGNMSDTFTFSGATSGVVYDVDYTTGDMDFKKNLNVDGTLKTETSIILEDPGAGTNTITFQAPTDPTPIAYTLPSEDGSANDYLATNGSGTLSWTSIPAIPTPVWGRTGTTLEPVTAGDDVDMGTGDIIANSIESDTTVRMNGSGSGYVAFQSPANPTPIAYTLPDTDAASNGYALTSDGAGTLSWQPNGGTVGNPGEVPYGAVDNSLTSEAAFSYNATSNTLTLDGVTSGASEFVINEGGADKDFRVESDTTDALFVQGSDGNVGIGTSAPNYSLQINNPAPTPAPSNIQITNSASGSGSGDGSLISVDGTGKFIIEQQEQDIDMQFLLDDGGTPWTAFYADASESKVGIGTTSPAFTLHVHNPVSATNILLLTNSTTGSASTAGGYIQETGTTLYIGNQETDGDILGYVDDGGVDTKWLQVSAATQADVQFPPVYNITTGSAANVYVGASGTLRRSTSSERYKSEIADFTEEELAKYWGLRPRTFTWSATGEKLVGFIAEEVHEIDPRLAVLNSKGEPDAVQYGNMVAVAIALIQEQQEQITELKNTLSTLIANAELIEQDVDDFSKPTYNIKLSKIYSSREEFNLDVEKDCYKEYEERDINICNLYVNDKNGNSVCSEWKTEKKKYYSGLTICNKKYCEEGYFPYFNKDTKEGGCRKVIGHTTKKKKILRKKQ